MPHLLLLTHRRYEASGCWRPWWLDGLVLGAWQLMRGLGAWRLWCRCVQMALAVEAWAAWQFGGGDGAGDHWHFVAGAKLLVASSLGGLVA